MHKVQYEIHLLNQRVPSIALALMKVTTGYGKEYQAKWKVQLHFITGRKMCNGMPGALSASKAQV